MRSFSRLYNEAKHRPRAYERVPEGLRKSFRATFMVQSAYRKAIYELKAQLPELPLSAITRASKEYIKAFYFDQKILNREIKVSSEKQLLKTIKQDVVGTLAAHHQEYLEGNLFLLDKSLESRRNVLLTHELETAEKLHRKHLESERRKLLGLRDPRKVLEGKFTQFLSVDALLDGENTQELTQHSELQLLSNKGVLTLPSQTGKSPRFADLNTQLLQAYAVHNIGSVEQGLQMFENSRGNPEFNDEVKAVLLQKLCLLSQRGDTEKKILRWLRELNVEKLSKKGAVDLFWCVTEVLRKNTPKWAVGKFLLYARNSITTFNSMNLLSFVKALDRVNYVDNEMTKLIEERYVSILSEVPVSDKKTNDHYSYIQLPLEGHSMFAGFIDRTIPMHGLPASVITGVLKYLYKVNSTVFSSVLEPSARIIEKSCLGEYNLKSCIQSLSLFGYLEEKYTVQPDIRSVVIELSKITYDDIALCALGQLAVIGEALMNTGEFGMSGLFRALVNKSTELIGIEGNINSYAHITRVISRYSIAVKLGLDIKIEPYFWIKTSALINIKFFERLSELIDVLYLSDIERLEICYYSGLSGHIIAYEPNNSLQSMVNTVVLKLKQSIQTQTEIMESITSQDNIHFTCETIVALSVMNAKIDWKMIRDYTQLIEERIDNDPDRVAVYWALYKQKVPSHSLVEPLNKALLTQTDIKLLQDCGTHI